MGEKEGEWLASYLKNLPHTLAAQNIGQSEGTYRAYFGEPGEPLTSAREHLIAHGVVPIVQALRNKWTDRAGALKALETFNEGMEKLHYEPVTVDEFELMVYPPKE